jgi:uncharacterized membrane protein YraQ (UPF0718 family)
MTPAWIGDASLILISLLVQGIPFLLLGAFLGALVSGGMPITAWLRRWPRNPALSALAGAGCAIFIPACDCAVVPLVRRLIRKGAPLSAGIAYLVAAPVLNPICLLSTWLAFRLGSPWHIVALRAGGSLLLAMVAGIIASRFSPGTILKPEVLFRAGPDNENAPWMEITPSSGPFRQRTAAMVAAGLTDFLNVSALYVLGAMCSALLQTFLPLGKMFAPRTALGIPAAMLLAFLFSLCSSADAFVVNAFGSLGLAGQLAFMWLGPVYNLRILFLYPSIFQYRAMLGLGFVILLVVALMAFALRCSGGL